MKLVFQLEILCLCNHQHRKGNKKKMIIPFQGVTEY